MNNIELTQGKFAIVDDADYAFLMQWNWRLQSGGYASRVMRQGNKQISIYMHREIMNASFGCLVDHIDGNKLNNRRLNLRTVSHVQNGRNAKKHVDGSSRFKGVSWDKTNEKWKSRLRVDNREMFLGRFSSEIEAALAYNEAAKNIYGEFAKLNEIREDIVFS